MSSILFMEILPKIRAGRVNDRSRERLHFPGTAQHLALASDPDSERESRGFARDFAAHNAPAYAAGLYVVVFVAIPFCRWDRTSTICFYDESPGLDDSPAEGIGQCDGDFRFRENHIGLVGRDGRFVFLFHGQCEGSAFLGFCPGDPHIGFGLVGL